MQSSTRFGAGVALFLLLVSSPARSAPSGAPPAAREPILRVAVLTGVPQLTIDCDERMRVWRRGSGLAGSVLQAGRRLRLTAAAVAQDTLRVRRWGIVLTDATGAVAGPFAEELLFEPLVAQVPIRVDGKTYRGEIIVRAGLSGALAVVNAVRIEDYLRGVVPLEIGSGERTPAEALKAQTIAARSYALFYLGRRSATHGCDLLAGAEDQVYGGVGAETPAASRAVVETRGVVGLYHGRVIRANYSSTCGGTTEAAALVWPGESFGYLRSVSDRDASGRPYCAGSRQARWDESWDCAQFAAIVLRELQREVPEAYGRELGRLIDIRVLERTPCGRVACLLVETDAGRYRVYGDRVRWLMRRPDGTPLRSALIGEPRREEGANGCRIVLTGGGYGHGVGLCQYGALERARRGQAAGEILRHYYPGVRFVRWW
jgi:stage II sporulation protein D